MNYEAVDSVQEVKKLTAKRGVDVVRLRAQELLSNRAQFGKIVLNP